MHVLYGSSRSQHRLAFLVASSFSNMAEISRSKRVAFLVASMVSHRTQERAFCFRQSQFCRAAVPRGSLWLSGKWRVVKFHVLSAAKDIKKWIAACGGEMGELHAPNSLCICGNWRAAFSPGPRVHAALEKMSSFYLKDEFSKSACRFLEDFTSTVLSFVAARSKLCQGVSFFCLEKFLGTMTIPPSSSLGSCWMDLLITAGREGLMWRLAKPNSNLSYESSTSWNNLQQGSNLM